MIPCNPQDAATPLPSWESAYRTADGRSLWPGGPMPPVAEFLLSLQKSPTGHILDAGCGDGRHIIEMARQGFPSIVGADGSATALTTCRARFESLSLSTSVLHLIHCNLENITFQDAYFDAVICTDALVHNTMEESVRILRELARLVRPGGSLLFNLCTDKEPVRELPGMRPAGPFTAWYEAKPGTARYYYEFYDLARANELVQRLGVDIRNTDIRGSRWWDQPHVGFREYEHEHDGWFIVLHF